jgi:hypothetical protein
MIIPSNIEFKIPELLEEYQGIRARLQLILEDMAQYVTSHGHKFIITDLLSEEAENKKLNRISTSHSEGRAADLRVYNWPLSFRKKFEDHFEKKYKHWAAMSKKTGLPNLIEIHDNGNGIHTHIQIAPYKEKL